MLTARGAQGSCTLPDSAVGVVLTVTAVDASQATFLTLYPAGTERLTASHLNPSPGAPPAPNAVTVDLSSDGEFSVFNRFGTVHVIADVVGYYTDHHHDDRYYTEPEVDAAQLQTVVDSRVPVADSTTMAGGAFVPFDAELELAAGSACFKPTGSGGSMRHSIPVTAGSTVTAFSARTRNPTVYPATFTVRMLAQRAGSADGVTVHVASIDVAPDTPLHETRIELPTPELVDAGEAVYMAFYQPGNLVYLCAVDVEFTRPG